MQHVCDDMDYDGKSSWSYDDERQMYVRMQDGVMQREIHGQQIPNPVALWKEKCKQVGVEYPEKVARLPNGNILRLKPTEATFKLWEHWNGQHNN